MVAIVTIYKENAEIFSHYWMPLIYKHGSVEFIVIDNNTEKVKDGILADVAPSILDLMKLNQPKQMTGKSLLS